MIDFLWVIKSILMEGNGPFILYNTVAGGDDTGSQGVSNHAFCSPEIIRVQPKRANMMETKSHQLIKLLFS